MKMSFQRYDEYEFGMYPRYNKHEKSKHQQQQQQQQQQENSQIHPSPRDAENINEIRKLIREQSNLANKTNIIRVRNSNSDSSDDVDIEVPVRRFTPLPDIPRAEDAYYRTESKLIKEKSNDINDENADLNLVNQQTNNYNYLVNSFNNGSYEVMPDQFYKFNNVKKETRYHFGASNTNKVNYNQRLPALDKQINYSLQNAMDLDEDLPLSNEPSSQNQRMIYTSPGDRMISPIKRPQAPSPAASAYRRKANKNSDSDSDNDIIIS